MSFAGLSAGNIAQYNTQVEQLIRQIIQTESQPVVKLQERKGALSQQQEIFDQASSALATLQNKADALGSQFDQRQSTTSDPNVVGVSAGAGARPGSYEITVERLAKAHTLASHRIPAQGRNLAEFFGTGERGFFLTIQGQRVEVRFEIPEVLEETGERPTNEELLQIVAQAVRAASAAAGLGQSGFTAEMLRDTPTTARLVLKSQGTGSANQMFLEDPDGVLQVLGVDPSSKATDLLGGWIHAPEGQARIQESTLDLFQPLADLAPGNTAAVSEMLNTLASYAARLTDGEGQPLAQALTNVVDLLNRADDLSEDPELELAFESLADLVDRLDAQAVEALAREFLRRAGELRGPEAATSSSASAGSPGIATSTNPPLSNAFDALAVAVRLLHDGEDIGPAFEDFRIALEDLSTQDRAELIEQFQEALDGLNALRRKEGEDLTDAFVRLVRPLFDLTIDERSSITMQFFQLGDFIDTFDTPTATRAAEEFRELADLIESLSQPLSDPLETPYAAVYAVLYVLPPETREQLATECARCATQLDREGREGVGDMFRNLAGAVSDPNLEQNFTYHFRAFATAVGSLSLADRHVLSQQLGTFTEQICSQLPENQAQILHANLDTLYRSIGELNQFQRVAFEDRMIALTEALDALSTDERARVREEMLKSLDHLRTLFPIALPETAATAFQGFNGAANDLGQEDRTILSAELARLAAEYHEGSLSLDAARALDALSRTTFYAGEPGALDAHQQQFLWALGALDDSERLELVQRLEEAADRLPGLIGEDSVKLVPALRRFTEILRQPIEFEASAAGFLGALEGAAAATGTFNDDELEQINRYLPELAEALARNVNDRGHALAQNLYWAGQAFARLSPGAQGILGGVLEAVAEDLSGQISGADGEAFSQQVQSLIDVLHQQDSFEGLDARLTIDGLPVLRGSNTITDLLEGVTLDLQNLTPSETAGAGPHTVQIRIDPDTEGLLQGLQEFVDAYNAAIDFLETQTSVDATTQERAPLAGHQDYLRLRRELRQAISQPIEYAGGTAFLRDLGIGIGTGVNDSNHLQILDRNRLLQVLNEDPDRVRALLTASGGAVTRTADLIEAYLQPEGVLRRDLDRLDRDQTRLDERLEVLNDRLGSREDFLRNEFNAIAEQLIALTSQTQALQGLGSSLNGLAY